MREEALTDQTCDELVRRLAGDEYRQLLDVGELDAAATVEGVRIRINLFRQQDHSSAALRLLTDRIPELERLGLPPKVEELTDLSRGIVLVTGETGSGKSTTLAAMNAMKLAVVKEGRVQKLCVSVLPDHLVRDGRITSLDALAEELHAVLRQERITAKKCALVLSPETAFVRRITVPRMTAEQLSVNLPYEFHDYIQKDKELYFYDYAVVGTTEGGEGESGTLELLAAAAPKEVISDSRFMKSYTAASSLGGFSLSAIITSKHSFRSCEEPRFEM